jgi:arginyl-tRNA synthetase
MHFGHLRSINIGEFICRLLEFCDVKVIHDSHIRDWDLQFGILIAAIKNENIDLDKLPIDTTLAKIEGLYKLGNAMAKGNENCLFNARNELVMLQNGDGENIKNGEKINGISYAAFEKIYSEFNVKFDHILGESFYRDRVGAFCESLEKYEIARTDNGALVVFR